MYSTFPGDRVTAPSSGTPVLIVDDHALFAQVVELALLGAGIPAERVVPHSTAGVLAAARAAAPATVLLDLSLGVTADGTLLDGADLVGPLVRIGCRVVVVTAEPAGAAWGRVVERGAATVLPKDVDLDRLLAVLGTVRAGGDPLPPGRRHELLAAARAARIADEARLAPFRRLSPREAEVLRHLAGGLPAGSIAARSFVSEATVRTQIRAVLSKLEVSSQLQAVAVARRARWFDEASTAG